MTVPVKRAIVAGVVLLILVGLFSLTLGRELLAGRQPSLRSFSLIHFVGYLPGHFFLPIPVEVLVPYYLQEGYPGGILVAVAIGTALLAQLLGYGLGYLFSEKVINQVIGPSRYARAAVHVNRYGAWAILAFNLLPLSSPTLVLVAGMLRYRLDRTLLVSAVGLTVKYTAISLFFRSLSW